MRASLSVLRTKRTERGQLHHRAGFTLIELLVVISIIAVLMGLLLPAVQSAREAGRRTQCMNNMRNLGLGVLQYANSKQTFPNAGTFGPDPVAGNASIQNIALSIGAPTDPAAGLNGSRYSWVVDILPYIDQQDLSNKWNKGQPWYSTVSSATNPETNQILARTSIPVLTCPNDDTVVTNEGNLSYVANLGYSRWHANVAGTTSITGFIAPPNSGTFPTLNFAVNNGAAGNATDAQMPFTQKLGVMFLGTTEGNTPYDYKTRLTSITDGSATTVMLTENVLAGNGSGITSAAVSGLTTGSWSSPAPTFSGFIVSDKICPSGNCTSLTGATEVIANAKLALANSRNSNPYESPNGAILNGNSQEGTAPYPNSNHPGGFVSVMCDGSAKFIQDTIGGDVWAKAITPQGGKAIFSNGLGQRQFPLDADALSN